jgi:hypothetical protein
MIVFTMVMENIKSSMTSATMTMETTNGENKFGLIAQSCNHV